MASSLAEWKDQKICVITSDGRVIVGMLVGYDQVQNLIIDKAEERVYSEDSEPELADLGLYVIRGDNVCMVADFESDSWKDVKASPLPSIQQQQK